MKKTTKEKELGNCPGCGVPLSRLDGRCENCGRVPGFPETDPNFPFKEENEKSDYSRKN